MKKLLTLNATVHGFWSWVFYAINAEQWLYTGETIAEYTVLSVCFGALALINVAVVAKSWWQS